MFETRSLAFVATVFALSLGVDAHAQIAGTAQAPKPAVTVTESSAISSATCGKPIVQTYTIKNVGSVALTTKITLNGADTSFTLAKGEQKAIVATGGNYLCSSNLSFSASIANPLATGGIPTPLWSKQYEAAKVTYPEWKGKVNGNDFLGSVLESTCGSPQKIYLKYPSGPALSVVAKFGGESSAAKTMTPPNASANFTSTASLSCASGFAKPSFSIMSNGTLLMTGDFQPSVVSLKP